MCCNTTTGGHHGMRGMRHQHACFCGCHDSQLFQRRFVSQKQRVTRLEAYLKELKEEAKAVEEQLDGLKRP